MSGDFVPHGNSTDGVPLTPDGQPIPPEPFSYMSQPGGSRPKIRSPLGLFLLGLFFVVMGILILIIVLGQSHGTNALVAGIFVLVMFGGLGTTMMIMGAIRMKWKKEFTKVTGHKPF